MTALLVSGAMATKRGSDEPKSQAGMLIIAGAVLIAIAVVFVVWGM